MILGGNADAIKIHRIVLEHTSQQDENYMVPRTETVYLPGHEPPSLAYA